MLKTLEQNKTLRLTTNMLLKYCIQIKIKLNLQKK